MRAALNRQGHFGWAGRTTYDRPEGRHLYLHQEHQKLSRAQLARSSDFRKLAWALYQLPARQEYLG